MPADELARAKNYVALRFPSGFETTGDISRRLEEVLVYRLPDDYFAKYVQNIEAVTAADVQRVAQKYIQPDRFAVVVVGDRKVIEPGIRALNLGAIKALTIDEIFKESEGLRPSDSRHALARRGVGASISGLAARLQCTSDSFRASTPATASGRPQLRARCRPRARRCRQSATTESFRVFRLHFDRPDVHHLVPIDIADPAHHERKESECDQQHADELHNSPPLIRYARDVPNSSEI